MPTNKTNLVFLEQVSFIGLFPTGHKCKNVLIELFCGRPYLFVLIEFKTTLYRIPLFIKSKFSKKYVFVFADWKVLGTEA